MKRTITAILTGLFLVLLFAGICPAETGNSDDTGKKVRGTVDESMETRKQTQQEREQWQAEKQELTDRYDRLQEKKKRL
ncbi:MAG: hypothetical protein KFF46_09865, partial [Desulfobacterales bacterium]|nr:hypothetical protein [Desulfobacterales bacterium]